MIVKKTAAKSPRPGGANILNYSDFIALLTKMLGGKLHDKASGSYIEVMIDNYANIISWYDYSTASLIMEDVMGRYAELLREGDAISRLYLDRIGIILKGYSPRELEKLTQRIFEITESFETKEFRRPMHLVASMGSVDFPASARRVEEVMHKSYVARISAGTGVQNLYYARYEDVEAAGGLSSNEARIMHDVQKIIDENRFKPAFQPIIDSKTGEVAFYECLLRIEDPDGKKVTSAGGLIPVAEKMNIIKVIDRIMLQHVVNELKSNPKLRLTFNISNATTDDAEWLKLCTKLLKNPEVASRVVVEITETAAHRDLRETAYFVASLQGLGCMVALDDFGAGYTSFRQLKSLSVDMVKIDGAYVTGLVTNRENQVFIKTLLEFTGNYGLKTIAEFVESGDVAKMLIDMGADYLQGYYFGTPEMGKPWKEKPADLFRGK